MANTCPSCGGYAEGHDTVVSHHPQESRAVTENVRLISVSMSKWLYASWLTSAERQRIVDEQRRLDQFVKEFEARAGKRWERFNIEPAKRGERRLDRLPIDYKEQT